MAEEGVKSSFGWRILALGSLFTLALALGLMTFVFIPEVPSARFTGVVWVALATTAGIRENAWIVAAAFIILGGATGLGYADRLLKLIFWLSTLAILFFGLAAYWTLRTIPAGNLLDNPIR